MKKLKNLKRSLDSLDPSATSWTVSGLGLLVSTLGARMLNRKFGAGILGFGLAHIVLGQLDRFRPTVRERYM